MYMTLPLDGGVILFKVKSSFWLSYAKIEKSSLTIW